VIDLVGLKTPDIYESFRWFHPAKAFRRQFKTRNKHGATRNAAIGIVQIRGAIHE
jgi:hypothetical protein